MDKSKHRARKGMASAGMTNLLSPNGVLLVGEDQTGEGGQADVSDGSNGSIENADTNGEFDVAEAEGFTERIGGGSLSIFPGTIEVEKGNVRNVDNSVLEGGRS
jgi:hypothetical protein